MPWESRISAVSANAHLSARLSRCSWLTVASKGGMVCTKRYRSCCRWLVKDDECCGANGATMESYSVGRCSSVDPIVGGDGKTIGVLSSRVAASRRPGLHRENGLPDTCRVLCVKPQPVNGYKGLVLAPSLDTRTPVLSSPESVYMQAESAFILNLNRCSFSIGICTWNLNLWEILKC